MRTVTLVALATLVAGPALAQPYGPPPYGGPPGYGAPPPPPPYGGPPPPYGALPPSVAAFREARHADDEARRLSAIGDFRGAERAHAYAERRRYEAEELRRRGE